jgi:putative ABC transport system permease protein
MWKNYLTVAFRALRKQAGYSLLNVGGLGLGLACAFLIVLFIRHELAFDRFHAHGERVYRLLVDWDEDGGVSATTAAGYGQHLPPQLPEVEAAVRVENHRRPYFRVGGETRQVEETMAIADPAFFEVFSFRLLRGDPATVLDDPGNLVVTERGARALFGDADPMGQVLVMPRPDEDLTFTVAGVMEDVPATSHFTFDYLAPFALITEFMGEDALENYTNYNYGTYVLLRPGADPAAVAAKVNALEQARLAAAADGDAEATAGGDGDDGPGLALQPLFDIHFDQTVAFGAGDSRDVSSLYLFGAVGLLVLLIACVNFTNLATARAAKRAREVGVRKAIGAQQGQLVGQFLGESLLLSVLAVGLGLGLATLALPVFNAAMGTELALVDAGAGVVALLVAIGLTAGLLAGSYPAFYLSAFQPARVLRGEVTRGQGAAFLRRGLIVGQFTVSVVLIVATLTVYRQLQFMRTRDLGFEKEQVVFLTPPPPVLAQYDALRERLLADPRITHVAQAGGLPGRTGTSRGYNWPGQEGAASGPDGDEGASFYTIPADPDFVETLGLELLAGRTFSREAPTDTMDTYVLNEAAVARLGWTPEEAVDQPFRAWDRPMGRVIGVVRDFHFQSLHETVQPLVLNYIPWFGNVAIRLAPGDVRGALAHVRASWAQLAPGYVFDYTFLDEDFDRQYREEEREGQLFAFFATVAVFIACLGLFGLAAYAAERRTKEIGVRKVLGASARDVVLLLSREFTVLVVVAFLVAVPVAWWAMSRWLEGFAYRVDLGAGVFLAAGLLAVAVGFLTVSTQALRAASTDPVNALRYE